MDKKVAAIVELLQQLTLEEKAELQRVLGVFVETGRLSESVKREAGMIMGPLSTVCPFCGK